MMDLKEKRPWLLLLAGLLVFISAGAQNGPRLRRIQGQGNDGLVLDLVAGMHDSILNSATNAYSFPLYESNNGPVKINILDPSLVPQGNFTIYFNSTVDTLAKWTLIYHGTPPDTVFGDSTVSAGYTQVIPQWGMSIWAGPVTDPGYSTSNSNGFLEATMNFSNSNQWLTGLNDIDNSTYQNWIRAGAYNDSLNPWSSDYLTIDPAGFYETVLGGTWAPYRLCASDSNGPVWKTSTLGLTLMSELAGIDIVITADTSKWSRCAVLETGYNDANTVGPARYLDLRTSPSVDKNGLPGDGVITSSINDADYISSTGMGWFPGYAINVETGERLNISFGEDSGNPNDNGTDMAWNPTSTIFDMQGQRAWGGKHYIYVFGHNGNGSNDIPLYDGGAKIRQLLDASAGPPPDILKRNVYADAMWVNIPLLAQGQQLLSSDVNIRLRVAKPYRSYATYNPGSGLPEYTFNTSYLLGIQEQEQITFDLFPNPAGEQLNIMLSPAYANAKYEVLDIRGITVASGSFNSTLNHLSTQQLNKGIYVLKIASENRIFSRRFIRQ